MGKQLQVNWLQKLSLKPQQVSFRIRDGVLELLDSLNFNLSNGMIMKLSGQSKLNQSIQYGGWMKIPSTLLGAQNKVLAGWAKQATSKGLNLEQLNTIPVDIAIGGTITKPSMQLSLKGVTQSVVSNLKGQAVAKGKEEYEKRRQAALAQAKKKVDMITKTAAEKAQLLRNEARIQGDKIVGEAKSVASQIRQEGDRAQERITKEANTQAAAIEAKATDPIQKTIAKKAAEKVRDEGRKKGEAAKGEFYLRARQTEDEGQKKAGQLQTQANKNADNIEQEAKEKADRLIKEAESGSSL
jgi:bisphosphoglycerate-dependent phosphoglycerate mutase